jgi:hypothetical protein
MNTLIPAIRRGFGRARIARGRAQSGVSPRGMAAAPTLSREEYRQAVIEVLG